MCIALYYINKTSKFRFVLIFNREEYSNRPTDKLKVLISNSDNQIIGGQDKLQSGTWLAFNLSNGMISFLTNRNQINHTSFTQKLSQIVNMMRFQYPKIMSLFYPKLKSRGQLILDLVTSNINDYKLNYNFKITNSHLKCTYESIKIDQIDNVKSRVMQAYLHKQNYMGFNLFVGNIFTANYYTFSSLTGQFQEVNSPGTVCSFSTIGQFSLIKEQIAKRKFLEFIENSTSIDKLFDQLFELAQKQFKSTEAFFKAFPEESQFFIPEYTNKLGRKRGTRTTTILIYDGNEVQIKEKTYI